MSTYDAKMRQLKRNFNNKRPIYGAAECILTLTCVNSIRANVTHTPTQYSYISLLLHQAECTTTVKSMVRNQHARATVSQALCYIISHIT